MTIHTVEIDAAPLSLDAAIAIVRAAGYTVTAPKAPKSAPFRNDLIVGYKAGMKAWEKTRIEVTFADGVTTFAYAMRETPSKPWFAGSAIRAACDRYRYRSPKALLQRIDHLAVPAIVAVSGIPVDLSAANAATANYRASDPDRPRKLFNRTAHL